MKARIFVIAGSDSGGGAGIQADIKTITALGGYAASAITALTAQNTCGVFGIHPVPAEFVAEQIRLVLTDMGADCLKTGMLLSADIIAVIADQLSAYDTIPLVVDPVMISKNGTPLLTQEAQSVMVARLFPRAALITPNIPEAEALLHRPITDLEQQIRAAHDLLKLGPHAVLLKGGHSQADRVVDVLATASHHTLYEAGRTPGKTAHGTGCTLASAIATGVGQGLPLEVAIKRAHDYVQQAIKRGFLVGHGHPVLDHGLTVLPFDGLKGL